MFTSEKPALLKGNESKGCNEQDSSGRGAGYCRVVGGTHLHTFMMWEQSAEWGGARLVGEAGELGMHWAAMQWCHGETNI